MVYRLLFLFVAEDRGLLLDPKASETAKQLFIERFSAASRLLAEKMRGSSRHHDLFNSLKMVLSKLGEPAGCPELALPALGGFLFAEATAPDLDSSEIGNADLLEAIRFLAVTREGGRLARVDYKNLGTEELGSVYESLLELHPDLSSDGTWFELKSASGNERKTSGSYYTPDSLIQCLLDTALDPVVEDALIRAGSNASARAKAILDLQVIDPAVGSGHFLIAAAHRLAKWLAQVRSGEEEPSQMKRAMPCARLWSPVPLWNRLEPGSRAL
ncbi:MAG: N-6 DNA methylase [Fimbriimonadales bacterium]